MKRDRAVSFDIVWQACIGCSACVAVCPQPEPFVSPHDTIALNTPCQIACMRCVEVCPTSAITFERLASDVTLAIAKSPNQPRG
jgi:ferredoxin